MISRKKQITVLGVIVVAAAFAVFQIMLPLDEAAITKSELDPALAGATDSGLTSPVDKSARWGFVLYDDVKMTAEPAASGAAVVAPVILNTGDQVYIGETDHAHVNQVKVTLFDGKSGWIDATNVFEATAFAPWNFLDSSTAPPKDWIPEELVPPASISQYRVVVSSEFLMRASKNANTTIADWAQAVLSAQAGGAAQ